MNNFNINDNLSFKDCTGEKHGLHGHVSIYHEDPETKKLSLWDESDNIIPISGYQWILMKMFDLYLDSSHKVPYEQITQDTTIEIPDLNYQSQLNIGTNPTNYTPIDTNIPESHFVQGFMVGNGGGAEDGITAKNTDYSFTKLRNPIPFQQTDTTLDPSIAGQYLGIYRPSASSSAKSYYIKKFDERPHIYHSWWRSGQAWNYLDPVTQADLGPDSQSGNPKTNRIETYVSCQLSISDTDCQSFFQNSGNNQSAVINELGLVAYDAIFGTRSIIQKLYQTTIKKFLDVVFSHLNEDEYTTDDRKETYDYAKEIFDVLDENKDLLLTQSNINNFYNTINMVLAMVQAETLDYALIKESLGSSDNIEVVAYYNQSGTYINEEDKFLEYLGDIEFTDFDEAQRIKLITYYTFRSIPIQSNSHWKILYRIYLLVFIILELFSLTEYLFFKASKRQTLRSVKSSPKLIY
jgi:hypothetical protein